MRILQPSDASVLEEFLAPRLVSSMILLSNSRAAGLVDRGQRHEGSYAGVFDDRQLVGVVGHFWNGNAILQTPEEHSAALCALAVRASGRELVGLLGPSQQVGAALAGLGIGPLQLRLDSLETLFALQLDALQVPASLREGRVQARVARAEDLELLAAWRVAFEVETLNAEDSPDSRTLARSGQESAIARACAWVVEVDGTVVAMTGIGAATAEAVQIGGVYTPPEFRGRGYARSGVAQSLLDSRQRGVRSSILFTRHDNVAARRAYIALGYTPVGDYRLAFLNAE